MEERKSFVMYTEWAQHFEMFTDEELGRLLRAVYSFVSGEEQTELGDRSLIIVFNMMRECITRDQQRWEETRQKRRENGAKGGRPKKAEKTDAFSENQSKAKKAVSESESESESEYESNSKSDSESVNSTCYSEVDLSEEEMSDLVRQADRLTVDRYILKIIDWQRRNKKLNSKPYISIKKWIEEDGARPKSHYNENGISTEEYDAFARSIDFDKLSTK